MTAQQTAPQTQRQTIRLDAYQPHPRNYNRHPAAQVKRIAHSLETFGQVRAVVVWRGYFLAGHGVAEAARSIGWATLEADALPDDYPEEKALAYLAADNELSRQADPDLAQLAAIIEESRQADPALMAAIGYDEEEFNALLAEHPTDAAEKARETLAERFLIPPFSVLDSRQGYWQERKRAWIALGIQSELGRGQNLLDFSNTILRSTMRVGR